MSENKKYYEVVIIGGGAAGLSAAIYAARGNSTVAVVEDLAPGGVLTQLPEVENYPGLGKISGYELAQKMENDARSFGAEIIYGRAVNIFDGEPKRVIMRDGSELEAGAVILATGNKPRKLGLEGEDELLGRGVSYCATCDGNFFRGKKVAVAGGKTAEAAAKYLLPIASAVYRVHGGSLPDIDGVKNFPDTKIVALHGDPLRSVTLKSGEGESELEADGLFVCLGYEPSLELVRGFVDTDEQGYIVCDERMQTTREGVFAAGDAVHKVVRQIVTAAADGAVAGLFASVYAKRAKYTAKK